MTSLSLQEESLWCTLAQCKWSGCLVLDHLLAHRVLAPSLLHSQVNMCLALFCNRLLHLKLSDANTSRLQWFWWICF
jgi:hypothetical protein